jgi:hypothetical protein
VTVVAHTTSATVEVEAEAEAEAGCGDSVVRGRCSVVQRCGMRNEAKRDTERWNCDSVKMKRRERI